MSYVNMTGEALERACRKTIEWANDNLLRLKLERDKEIVQGELERRNFWRKITFRKLATYDEVYKDLDKLPRSHIDGWGDDYFMKTIPWQMYKMTAERLLCMCRINGELALNVYIHRKDYSYLLWL